MVSCEEYFEKVKSEMKEKIAEENLQIKFGIVQVGSNPASNRYVRMKLKDCDEVGINAKLFRFENTISTEELEDEVKKIVKHTDSIIVQLPLPEHIDSKRILSIIPSEKDVDGLTLNSPYTPCTAKGVISYLEENKFKFEGSNAVVIGRSELAGKTIAELLNKRNATVTLCHSHTKDVGELLKNADLIIVAAGQRHMITKEMAELLLKKPLIVDVGINFDENGKMCGDVDYEKVAPYCKYVTPVPKGVGLLTRSALLENLVFGGGKQISDKELWDILYDEYKKHGNSMNGAQLTILSYNLKLMKQKYTNKEIGDMLKNHFDLYHCLSGKLN